MEIAMSQEDLELRIRRLLSAVNKVHDSIDSELKKLNLDRTAYSITSRKKSLARIRDKILRTKVEPEDITDLSGFRIVTYFQSGMIDAIESLLSLSTQESSEAKAELIRIIFYNSRPDGDPLSMLPRLKELLKSRNLEPTNHTPDTLYSSIHLIFGVQAEIETLDGGRRPVVIKVEFQVRSLFEEAWGQLSHILSYGRGLATPGPRELALHLNVLKTMIDGFIQYAELLKDQSGVSLMSAEAKKESSKSAQPVERVISKLPSLPDTIRRKFIAALKQRAHSSTADEVSSRQRFAEAAEAFAKIGSQILADGGISSEVKKEAIYAVNLERAYCLLFSKDDKSLDVAIALYEEIGNERKTDAVCRYRHAQAVRRKKQMQKAVTLFKECITLLNLNRDSNVQEGDWIHSAAFRELGYTYWLMSEENPGKKSTLLESAIDQTRLAMARLVPTDREGLINCLNNFVYYGWEERTLEVVNTSISDAELKTHMDILLTQDLMSVPDLEPEISLDTVCRALDFFDETGKAVEVAAKVVELVIEKARKRAGPTSPKRLDGRTLQRCLTNEEFDIYIFAMEVVGEAVQRKDGKFRGQDESKVIEGGSPLASNSGLKERDRQ
jgi:ppGpp synthetase/RelA/SpoT-type nucleotidyltranferase